jgi:hypothetical protein
MSRGDLTSSRSDGRGSEGSERRMKEVEKVRGGGLSVRIQGDPLVRRGIARLNMDMNGHWKLCRSSRSRSTLSRRITYGSIFAIK